MDTGHDVVPTAGSGGAPVAVDLRGVFQDAGPAPVAAPSLAVPTPDARLVIPAPPVLAPPEPPPPPGRRRRHADAAPAPRETNTRPPQPRDTAVTADRAARRTRRRRQPVLQTTANASELQKRAESLVCRRRTRFGEGPVRRAQPRREGAVRQRMAIRLAGQAGPEREELCLGGGAGRQSRDAGQSARARRRDRRTGRYSYFFFKSSHCA